jgi:ribosomal protein L16 Arg81 hydroxylase
MRFEDVERSLEKGTVSLSNAGFFMPPAAAISASLLEAMQLPIWLNIYVTKAGRTSSAPPHTDKQDVIAVQAQGAKRWRVFSPPSPAAKVSADPFTRGKGTDVLSVEEELDAPLIDTVLEPGQARGSPATPRDLFCPRMTVVGGRRSCTSQRAFRT